MTRPNTPVSNPLFRTGAEPFQRQESNNLTPSSSQPKTSLFSQSIFSPKYQQSLLRSTARMEEALKNYEPLLAGLLNFDSDSDSDSDSESNETNNIAVESIVSETPETDLEKNKFNRFKELYETDYNEKPLLTWLASKTTAFILGQDPAMDVELSNNRIKSWKQVVDYTENHPERNSATIRKKVEAEFADIDNNLSDSYRQNSPPRT